MQDPCPPLSLGQICLLKRNFPTAELSGLRGVQKRDRIWGPLVDVRLHPLTCLACMWNQDHRPHTDHTQTTHATLSSWHKGTRARGHEGTRAQGRLKRLSIMTSEEVNTARIIHPLSCFWASQSCPLLPLKHQIVLLTLRGPHD